MSEKVFDSGDDLEQLLVVTDNGGNNIKIIKERSKEIKRCVQALAKLGDKEHQKTAVHLHENKENNQIISQLAKEKSNKVGGIEKLDEALSALDISLRQVNGESSKHREQKACINHQLGDALPKTKFSFSLYSNITRLRWDYGTDGDMLQGFVTSIHDVRPFSLNTKEHSSHFIANYLWDVIASAKHSQA